MSNEDNEAVKIMAEWLGDDKILRFTTRDKKSSTNRMEEEEELHRPNKSERLLIVLAIGLCADGAAAGAGVPQEDVGKTERSNRSSPIFLSSCLAE